MASSELSLRLIPGKHRGTVVLIVSLGNCERNTRLSNDTSTTLNGAITQNESTLTVQTKYSSIRNLRVHNSTGNQSNSANGSGDQCNGVSLNEATFMVYYIEAPVPVAICRKTDSCNEG